MDPGLVAAGLGVGILVWLTGMGAGSLMTPILISVFGIPASTAVGTDLVYAAITKAFGAARHHQLKNVNRELALTMGTAPADISFAGPGKSVAELERAVRAGIVINVESARELRVIVEHAHTTGVRPKIAIRVNPDFELRGSGMKMGGGAKPFGIDQQRVPALAREIIAAGAEWRGLHIFTGSQALDASAIIETQGNVLELAAKLTEEIGNPLPHLNMGGGFGIPYFNGDQPLDIAAVGAALKERFANLPPELTGTEFAIELGRYLVGEAGVYLTRIVDRKESMGRTFLVTDGGLQHQLAASGNFGQLLRRNYPVVIAGRFSAAAEEEVTVTGCLCTPLDLLADEVMLPRAEVGDLVAIFCAGAYGLTASPTAFLSQPMAREMLV